MKVEDLSAELRNLAGKGGIESLTFRTLYKRYARIQLQRKTITAYSLFLLFLLLFLLPCTVIYIGGLPSVLYS